MKVSDDYSFKTSYPQNVQKLLYLHHKKIRKFYDTV